MVGAVDGRTIDAQNFGALEEIEARLLLSICEDPMLHGRDYKGQDRQFAW